MTPVDPGPASVVEVAPDLWSLRNRGFASNTYVGRLRASGACLVVDPGLDHAALDSLLSRVALRPTAVFCTHGHFDHLGGAARLQETYGAVLHVHVGERKVVRTANFTRMICKVEGAIVVPRFDVEAEDGDRFLSGDDQVGWVHTPGHTPGSSFVTWRGCVFTGDTLYRDTVGLVRFPGEDPVALRASLTRIWDEIPPAALICPGHGPPGVFAGIQRDNLPLRSFLGLAGSTPREG